MLECDAHSTPRTNRGTRRIKRSMHKRVISAHGRERPRDERTLVGKSRRSQLSRRVVVMVEEVVNSYEQLNTVLQLVPCREVHNPIAGRRSRPEIVDAVGVALVIFVAAGI